MPTRSAFCWSRFRSHGSRTSPCRSRSTGGSQARRSSTVPPASQPSPVRRQPATHNNPLGDEMTELKRRPIAAAVLAMLSTCALAQEQTLPEVKVRGEAERADGPVTGYRATRSSTATKTDTPLNEVPASVTVVPSTVMKDQAMQGMGDVFRYVPGVLMHQGEGNRD